MKNSHQEGCKSDLIEYRKWVYFSILLKYIIDILIRTTLIIRNITIKKDPKHNDIILSLEAKDLCSYIFYISNIRLEDKINEF